MPRFDNEGYNPNRRIDNDRRDRSVPDDENYYSGSEFGFSFRQNNGEVRDNQQNNNIDINSYIDSFDINSAQRAEKPELNNFDFQNTGKASKKKSNKPSAPKKRKRKKSHMKTGKKILLSVISIILVFVLIVVTMINGVLGKITYDEQKENEYISSSELMSNAMVKNILLLGVDARSDEDNETSRADSMMLLSIDMKNKCIKMVSFLRDSWVYIPAHEGNQRLNASCTYGGYSGVVDTIEYNFGIDIDGYVVADFEMFKVLVDNLGGVEVDVSEKEANEVTNHKKRYGNVTLEAGKHNLTGEQALAYCRIRKIDTDFMRTKRQRTVMQSIISGTKQANIFTLYKMANGSAPYIETNLTKGQLKRIALYAGLCMSGEMVETRVPFDGTWEYKNINGASVISLDTDENKQKLIDYLYNMSAEEIIAQQDNE